MRRAGRRCAAPVPEGPGGQEVFGGLQPLRRAGEGVGEAPDALCLALLVGEAEGRGQLRVAGVGQPGGEGIRIGRIRAQHLAQEIGVADVLLEPEALQCRAQERRIVQQVVDGADGGQIIGHAIRRREPGQRGRPAATEGEGAREGEIALVRQPVGQRPVVGKIGAEHLADEGAVVDVLTQPEGAERDLQERPVLHQLIDGLDVLQPGDEGRRLARDRGGSGHGGLLVGPAAGQEGIADKAAAHDRRGEHLRPPGAVPPRTTRETLPEG